MISQAASVLPEFMQVPAMMMMGVFFESSRVPAGSIEFIPICAGTPFLWAISGNTRTAPKISMPNGAPI